MKTLCLAAVLFLAAASALGDEAQHHLRDGLIAWNIGLSEAAISEFTEAIQLNPNFAEAYLDRGRLKLNKGDQRTLEPS